MRNILLTFLLLNLMVGCARAKPVPDTIDSELQATITSANQAFIRAVRSGDPAQLHPYYSGEIIASLSQSIERAKEAGMYSVSELQGVRWREARVRAGSAQVEVTERWQHIHHFLATGKCAFVVPARDVSQTYHLEKNSSGWVVTKIVDDPDNEPSRGVPCP